MKDNWIWLLGGGVLLYWLYEQGYLAQWFASPTTTAITTTPAAPASVTLASAVQLNSGSNSFSAQVLINGVAQPVTLGISTGVAEDQNGNNITTALQAEGVSIPGLLQMMQTAYSAQQTPQIAPASPAAASTALGKLCSNIVPANLVHGGTGL